jgi:iron(III) transport system substrate-binding protein
MNASKKQRIMSIAAVAGLAAIGVTACGGGGGGSGADLLIYHDFDAVAIEPIIDAFEQYHLDETGEEVSIETYHQPGGEMRVTLELEAGADEIRPDVVMIAHSELYALQEEFGLFEQLDLEGMDDEAIPEQLRDPIGDGYSIANSVQPYLIAYNRNNVAEDEVPSSWTDLLDTRWENQIGMGDPESTSGAHLPLWYLVEHLGNEIGSLNPTTASSHDAITEYVNSGELSLGIIGLATVVNAIESGQPIGAVVPEEGVPAFVHSSGITTTSEHPELAQEFLEWVISAEGQEAIYGAYPALPTRSDVEPTQLPFELAVEDVSPVDPEWITDNREENIQRFRDAIGSSGNA